jgi:pimeloyl-ACP methyl ester carboxylesterase
MSLPNVAYLRTPEDRFRDLPDFPYQPYYLQYGNLCMAYIDEYTNGLQSSTSNETFLCLHGQPTWSYLYRKMIPVLLKYTTASSTQPSRRIIAPDLLGFGRSDKPTADATLQLPPQLALAFNLHPKPSQHHARRPGLGRAPWAHFTVGDATPLLPALRDEHVHRHRPDPNTGLYRLARLQQPQPGHEHRYSA